MSRVCADCQVGFVPLQRELDFLKRVAPTVGGQTVELSVSTCCPDCRWRRRLSFRNERTLFRRPCDLTGKPIISIYPARTEFPVYDILEWVSDKWDPTDYARDFDFSRSFFEQYRELAYTVPHFNLSIDPRRDTNSDYTNCATNSKNCYLISQAEENEDCYYSRGINNSRDCCDCLRIDRCELCYEGINLSICYHCFYCQDCDNCSDCYFSTGLRGCRNCFACHNLKQQEYCYFNECLTKEEWKERVSGFVFDGDSVREARSASESIRLQTPHRYARIFQCQDSTGDHLMNCLDSEQCYDSRDLEHCTYVSEVQNGARFCQDYSICGVDAELVYECVGCGYSAYHILFCSACWQGVSELLYCENCGPGVKRCFGCNGLRSREYCILNKPYSRSNYEKLLVRIIKHMRETGEWGSFFPPWVSRDAYNDTIAMDFFPTSRDKVIELGWNWRDREELRSVESGDGARQINRDMKEGEGSRVLSCKRSGRQYRILKAELALLTRLGLPVPTLHPEERYRERIKRRNPRRLWSRNCDKCGQALQSSYAPEREERVYCEDCYLGMY